MDQMLNFHKTFFPYCNSSPVIICGCHGGGTSYIAKLLRYRGLFLGADAEPLNSRKYHESRVFRKANELLLERFGDKCGFAEVTVRSFLSHIRKPGSKVALAKELDLEMILNTFWGLQERKCNWGWKDPRNSLTFPIWQLYFPTARTIVVRKSVGTSRASSPSGKWFREEASRWLREQYSNPPWLNDSNASLVIDFERIVTDLKSFNELMDFTSLPLAKSKEFLNTLTETGFEGI